MPAAEPAEREIGIDSRPDRRLSGQAAIVTGGSRGIGFGIARRFARAGADVMLVSRNKAALEAAVASLVQDGVPATAIGHAVAHADDPAEAECAVRSTVERFGRADILVNNAGTNPYFGSILGIGLRQAQKTLAVNLVAPLVWAQLVWNLWMEANGGAILNIASNGGYLVDPNLGWYNTSKAALLHLTRQLGMEMAPAVRVNAIAPGLVKTDMSSALWKDDDGVAVSGAMPLNRLGEARDIAEAALFLCSSDSSWITGQALVVDGGFLVRSAL